MSNALKELIKSENDAREFGFDWPHEEMILEWIIGECKEVLSAIKEQESPARIQEEIGDVLHSAISLCIFAGFDVEETFTKTTCKFSNRMQKLKEIANARGLQTLHGQSLEFMLELWREAKLSVNN